jgi:hypothetical protein
MTTRVFTMSSTGYWNLVAASFASRALQAESLELVVDISTDHAKETFNNEDSGHPMVPENEIASNGLRYMRILGLGMIKFTISARRTTNGVERSKIVRKLLGTMVCRAQKVQLRMLDAGPALNAIDLEVIFREDKRWSLCDHCISKIPVKFGAAFSYAPGT